jgi:methylglutamate dehydrogenase subunit B
MLRLPCPFCGPRDHAEFDAEGAAEATPPLDAPADVWTAAVFTRDNPRGPRLELWRHARGCGAWLRVERDTGDHRVLSVAYAHPGHDG